jgi:hypothetical protein
VRFHSASNKSRPIAAATCLSPPLACRPSPRRQVSYVCKGFTDAAVATNTPPIRSTSRLDVSRIGSIGSRGDAGDHAYGVRQGRKEVSREPIHCGDHTSHSRNGTSWLIRQRFSSPSNLPASRVGRVNSGNDGVSCIRARAAHAAERYSWSPSPPASSSHLTRCPRSQVSIRLLTTDTTTSKTCPSFISSADPDTSQTRELYI